MSVGCCKLGIVVVIILVIIVWWGGRCKIITWAIIMEISACMTAVGWWY